MENFTPSTIETAAASMTEQHASAKRSFAWAVLVAAVVMIMLVALSATVGTTNAYFTTYATAKGSVQVSLNENTEIEEEFGNFTKSLTVTNNGGRDVYVRAKAFGDSIYPISYSSDGNWVQGDDGYYYYATNSFTFAPNKATGGIILKAGESTTPSLNVKINNVPSTDDIKNGAIVPSESFNVVLIYETTPVLYDDGTPYADWNNVLENSNPEGGDQ